MGRPFFPVPQAETTSKLSKGHFVEQVMVPVPIIPTRHNVSIHGMHAKLRLRTDQPEFYMRTEDARTPEMELVRAKAHGENRQIEKVDELFGVQRSAGDTISMQRWEIARGVYRFTLSKPLAPGEYALAEMVGDEGTSLYVWDFGVDTEHAAGSEPHRQVAGFANPKNAPLPAKIPPGGLPARRRRTASAGCGRLFRDIC